MESYCGIPRETKFNIDTLELMLNFIPVLESKTGEEVISELEKIKKFIEGKTKRMLNKNENYWLIEGICAYIQSDAETNERTETMKYLFNLEFISDDNTQK